MQLGNMQDKDLLKFSVEPGVIENENGGDSATPRPTLSRFRGCFGRGL